MFGIDIDDTAANTTEFINIATPQVITAMINTGLNIQTEHVGVAVDGLKQIMFTNPEKNTDINAFVDEYEVRGNRQEIIGAGINKYRQVRESCFHLVEHFLETFKYAISFGYTSVIVTNGYETRQRSKIAHLGLDEFVKEENIYISCAKKDFEKPSPEMLLRALKYNNADPDLSFYLGNTVTDTQAAHKAGIKAIRSMWECKHRGKTPRTTLYSRGITPTEIQTGQYDLLLEELTANYPVTDLIKVKDIIKF